MDTGFYINMFIQATFCGLTRNIDRNSHEPFRPEGFVQKVWARTKDTVNYKEVMKHFGLGPNGGIMTSLNLFATKFDQASCGMPGPARGGEMHTGVFLNFFWNAGELCQVYSCSTTLRNKT